MRARSLSFAGPSALLLLLTACASGGSPPPSGAEGEALFSAFSSTWSLIPEESVTFQQALQEAQGAMTGGSGAAPAPSGGGGGGRGGGRRGRDTSGGFSDATQQNPRGSMTGVRELGGMATNALTLAVSDTAIGIHPDGGMGLDLVPDEAVTRQMGQLQINITAHWNGREFDVERAVHDGATLTETYRVSDTGDRLYVERVIRTRGGPVIRQSQVYGRGS